MRGNRGISLALIYLMLEWIYWISYIYNDTKATAVRIQTALHFCQSGKI
jgi:hypothetical protein